MCQRKPGPRCTNHSKAAYEKAMTAFYDADEQVNELQDELAVEENKLTYHPDPTQKDIQEFEKLSRKLEKAEEQLDKASEAAYVAERNYTSSPESIKKLKARNEEIHKRVETLEKMYNAFSEHDLNTGEGQRVKWALRNRKAEATQTAREFQDASEQRAFEQRALKHELEREKRIADIEGGQFNGDPKAFRALVKSHVESSPEIQIDRMTLAEPEMSRRGDAVKTTYKVEVPHGGTATVTVRKEHRTDKDGALFTNYQTVTEFHPEKEDAPAHTRKGFGNAAPGMDFHEWDKKVTSEEQDSGDFLDEMREESRYRHLAETALKVGIQKQEQAYAKDALNRYSKRDNSRRQ